MKQIRSKKDLAVRLSRLEGFTNAKVSAEQYPTDSEIASDVVWEGGLLGDFGKVSVDLGSGTGILGIGVGLLGSGKVFMVENDKDALEVLGRNVAKECGDESECEMEIIAGDIADFSQKVDCVIMNPPFGTRQKHADRNFLVKAFSVADVVWSFHKTSTLSFVKTLAEDSGFVIERSIDYNFPLKKSMAHHKKKVENVAVTAFRFVRKK
jgi:putative methylase